MKGRAVTDREDDQSKGNLPIDAQAKPREDKAPRKAAAWRHGSMASIGMGLQKNSIGGDPEGHQFVDRGAR